MIFNLYEGLFNNCVIYIQYYLIPLFYILPLWVQLSLISMIAFGLEFIPFFAISYYILQSMKFKLIYSLNFIISGIIGIVVGDLIIFHITQNKFVTDNRFTQFIQYILEYPLILFILYRIIPYSRTVVVTILSNTYSVDKFYKWNIITAIILSIAVFLYMYFI